MKPIVKFLGCLPYEQTWEAMQTFTENRDENTPDELWVVEHPPVFTQGLNGKAEHLLAMQDSIPLVHTDRGGQVTYHGPGQLVIYTLLDLKRAKLGVRALVHHLEEAIIALLHEYGLNAQARPDAPGVYIENQKIASLGLKIRHHKSYHGLALNVDMDLSPFQWIRPCGLDQIQMTQLKDWLPSDQRPQMETLAHCLIAHLQSRLSNQDQV